ncbi:hypothetical protein BJX61DRAFT_531752 [Aspergillus egyptiacus]|nr:hypothetical protein BJX61DRAFT_531752 [Aspergillus egyptiacus]
MDGLFGTKAIPSLNLEEELLKFGRSRSVILRKRKAVNVLLRWLDSTEYDIEMNTTTVIQHEQKQHGRLKQCEGVMAHTLSNIHGCRVIVADVASRTLLLDDEFNIQFSDFTDDNNASRATWPRRETLPSTKDVWLGDIIGKCWTLGPYGNAARLGEDLDAVILEDVYIKDETSAPRKGIVVLCRMG